MSLLQTSRELLSQVMHCWNLRDYRRGVCEVFPATCFAVSRAYKFSDVLGQSYEIAPKFGALPCTFPAE